MKNIFQKLLMITVVGSFAFLYSCGEDEEVLPDAPTASASADATEYETGGTALITLDFTAPGGVAGINWTPSFDGNAGTKQFNAPSEVGSSDGATSGSINIEFPIDASLENTSVSILFEIVDSENQTATDSVSFTVVSGDPGINSFNAQLLYAPLQDGSSDTWFSTNLGTTVTEAEVNASAEPSSSDIDFGYYYGATDAASLAAPANYPTLGGTIDISDWNTLNSTTFRSTSLTASEFVEVTTSAAIDEAFSAGNDEGGAISGLSVDQVLAFELDADKGALKGLIRVVSIEGTFNQNDYIELEIIIQNTEE